MFNLMPFGVWFQSSFDQEEKYSKPSTESVHLFHVTLDVALALEPRGHHGADLAENRPPRPGPVVHAVNPGDTGVGVGIAAVDKIPVVQCQRRRKPLLRR